MPRSIKKAYKTLIEKTYMYTKIKEKLKNKKVIEDDL